MTTFTASHKPSRRQLALAGVTVLTAGLLGAAACSSGAAAEARPPASVVQGAPPPTTTASPPAAPDGAAKRLALHDILETHHAAGDFVGARIALRNGDGTIMRPPPAR